MAASAGLPSALALMIALSSFWSPTLAVTVMSLPSRHTPSLTEVPGFIAAIVRVSSLMPSMFLPSTLLITSPDLMPAASAGLSGCDLRHQGALVEP